ncbi:tyrosine-type recombinase/integrase [Coraliomargarita sp. W4R72]
MLSIDLTGVLSILSIVKCTIPKIKTLKYASGEPYHRVTYSLNGKQIRKNFADEKRANQYKQDTIRKYIGGVKADDSRLADAGYQVFKSHWVKYPDLEDVPFDEWIANQLRIYQKPVSKGILDLAVDYRSIKVQQGLREISIGWTDAFLVNGFAEEFKDRAITSITKKDLEEYLLKPNRAGQVKPNRNEIDQVKAFFNWLTGESPKTPIDTPILSHNPFRGWVNKSLSDKAGKIVVHTFDECKKLLERSADFNGQAFLVWMLHTGMRPTEAFKYWKNPNYGWNNIDFKNGLIHVPADVSKVRKEREIDISDTLRVWLKFYEKRKSFFEFTTQAVWNGKYVKIRKVLKQSQRGNDSLRHTRISVLVRKGIPLATIEVQMGNSKEIIKNHYLRHMAEDEAVKIDGLTPDQITRWDR